MTRDIFSEKLKKARLENKFSQTEIAQKIGVSQRAYSFYETGNTEPDLETLVKIADLFKTSIDYLLGRYN